MPQSTITGRAVSAQGIARNRHIGQSESPSQSLPPRFAAWSCSSTSWWQQFAWSSHECAESWKWPQPGSECRPVPKKEVALTIVSTTRAADCRKNAIKAATYAIENVRAVRPTVIILNRNLLSTAPIADAASSDKKSGPTLSSRPACGFQLTSLTSLRGRSA